MKNEPKPADRVFLTSEVERLSTALDQARADVALLRRLTNAEADAERLAKELSKAQDDLSDAHADAILKERKAEFANLRSIAVRVTSPSGRELTALSANYTITYERLIYDGRSSDWQPQSVNGLTALSSDVRRYLVLENPNAIPAIILDLAPGDPAAALQAYFIAFQRGYMSTQVPA